MNRELSYNRIAERRKPFDLVVIGGGATGAGIALDAASRGLGVVLFEKSDFGSGTSSRSTKIIHGGVRYLAQGHIGLVREALRERAILLRNAPHLVTPLEFVVPIESYWERAKYQIGLAVYDRLSASGRIQRSRWDGANERIAANGLVRDRFIGSISYYDAQFDDSRLLINILDTAEKLGAIAVNYSEVVALNHDQLGKIRAVTVTDKETNKTLEVQAHAFINATGATSDRIVQMDNAAHDDVVLPSQGAHIVVGGEFLKNSRALLMPKTPDGRVMFAIPWLGHTIIGTTDTEVPVSSEEPLASDEEIEMIISVASRYLLNHPGPSDILSTFAGIRPLAHAPGASNTAQVSREHRIDTFDSNLISVTGGKWTTYRLMAEQCVNAAASAVGWNIANSKTDQIALNRPNTANQSEHRHSSYGQHASGLLDLESENSDLSRPLHPELPYTMTHCLWAIRHEMARTIEDVLARRTRALFLNARAAMDIAPAVSELLGSELSLDDGNRDQQLQSFNARARAYARLRN